MSRRSGGGIRYCTPIGQQMPIAMIAGQKRHKKHQRRFVHFCVHKWVSVIQIWDRQWAPLPFGRLIDTYEPAGTP
jgi:hypothetical protein